MIWGIGCKRAKPQESTLVYFRHTSDKPLSPGSESCTPLMGLVVVSVPPYSIVIIIIHDQFERMSNFRSPPGYFAAGLLWSERPAPPPPLESFRRLYSVQRRKLQSVRTPKLTKQFVVFFPPVTAIGPIGYHQTESK